MSAYSTKRSNASGSTDVSQKELLVSQLRTEILELKQNEREYADLSAQLRKLEQRYSLLQEETARGEADFKSRNSMNFEMIVNLRTDIDTLRSTISDSKIELQDLRVENQTLKDLSEQKGVEVQQFKAQVGDASQDNEALTDNKRRLEAELDVAREEKRKLLTQGKEARATLGDAEYKNGELEKVMKEMEYNNTKTERQNVQLQQSIDNLNGELKTRIDNLEVIEQQVGDSQKAIAALDKEIQEARKEADRNRAEATKSQKTYQQEVTKSLDLNARIAVLENALRSKETEADELKRGYDNLKSAHSSLLDTNFQLKQDLDTVRGDIDSISAQNSEIVEELERLTQEDEQVRSILNRQNRVDALKQKSESQLRRSGLKSKGLSPSPERNFGRSPLARSPLRNSSLRKSPQKY